MKVYLRNGGESSDELEISIKEYHWLNAKIERKIAIETDGDNYYLTANEAEALAAALSLKVDLLRQGAKADEVLLCNRVPCHTCDGKNCKCCECLECKK